MDPTMAQLSGEKFVISEIQGFRWGGGAVGGGWDGWQQENSTTIMFASAAVVRHQLLFIFWQKYVFF